MFSVQKEMGQAMRLPHNRTMNNSNLQRKGLCVIIQHVVSFVKGWEVCCE